jgi:surfactin synthase thioesterase subunit
MFDVYCIPGLGADDRLFGQLKLENCTIHHIRWIPMLPEESMEQYALRLSQQIDTSRPYILLGVSMGGMISIEIARVLDPLCTILVSSCTNSAQLPLKVTFWKNLALYKLLDDKRFIAGAMLMKGQFGIEDGPMSQLFLDMLKSAPKDYFRRAVHAILNWTGKDVPERVIHIHGDKDNILPYAKIVKCDHVIKDGDHFMVMKRADEVSAIINEILLDPKKVDC